MKKYLLIALLALLLPGCGFHLRDALLLPPDLGPLRVVSRDSHSALAQSLAQALERAGAQPATADAADADADAADVATLNVVGERWGSDPISVDQFGRAQEFSLRYAVIFNLRRADGSDLVPQQAIELSRDYISVPTRSAGTEGEREILARELRRDMVASILNRIDAASRQPSATATSSAPTDATSSSDGAATPEDSDPESSAAEPSAPEPLVPEPVEPATSTPDTVPAPTTP